jgi:hypothetical protein
MTCLHFLFTPCRARKADDLPKNFGLLQQMQGAGACAQSGGKSALMDQLTAVLRKNRELQSRLNRKDFEMQEMQNEHEFQQALLQSQVSRCPIRFTFIYSSTDPLRPASMELTSCNSRSPALNKS